jgi:hypothetical protein
VEAHEDTDPEVSDDGGTRLEASSAVKPMCKTMAAAAKQTASTAATKVVASKTTKLEVEKKKNRKWKTSPPPAVEMPVIPTPSSREVELDEEEEEATDDPPIVEEWTVRRSLSPSAKRQQELRQKTTEDDLRQGLEAQRDATAAQERMPVLIKARTFGPKLHAPATVRYGHKTEGLLVDYLLLFALYCVARGFCRSVAKHQRDLDAQASPSRMRSPDHEVAMHTLAYDARTATPAPVADSRMATLPPAADARAQGSTRGITASTSPPVINVDPISGMPSGMDQDLVVDPTQIEQAPKDLGTFGAQVHDSASSGTTLTRWEISWNGTPWQEDIFDNNEYMRAVCNTIVTLNIALIVSFLLVFFLTTYF